MILSARDAAELERLAAELPGDGHRALPADLAEDGAAERLAAEAGVVEVLVANAGVSGTGRLDDFTPEEMGVALRVNLEAPMLLARSLAPAMVERGAGQLVFVASLSGKAASPRSSVYNATKFGLRGFALGLREDLRDTGVGVSTVFPGFISDAGMFHESGAKLPGYVAMKTPEDVAAAVVRAIERNRAEIDVAPLGLRLGTAVAGLLPELSGRVQRRLGSLEIAESMAEGQRDKR
jgi:short-subunit dehydrogenase